ncbi:MAG: 16S rRNA (cytosine(1402)-N(4))-methyltransferase RsmH [Candidatus Liberibacter ctenarytainae]|uniref:Ribosomal RNA small subunit methyltransferase H n=1 Tax=Candidatus Liberibacter ctenarytainae TaxID=2020335 RepID=A0A937DLX8_9HYPH|nr:16S rRNA (cytosine(1402)-N(4))-methyltransferase RsmH [Candidatus Liberibacter ctenarytainae]
MKCAFSEDISSAINQEDPHTPVLLPEVVALMKPEPGKSIVDATFGAGGYSRHFCKMGANVIGLDRDPLAVSRGQEMMSHYKDQFSLFNTTFSQLQHHVPDDGVDGIVFDLGVSSMQIDQGSRGFSFQKDGPLDMRMSCSGVSASDVVNRVNVKDLIRILGILGEEKQATRIAHAIVKRRKSHPFQTTQDLSSLIQDIVYINKKSRIHPATRSFQALRMFVNDELKELLQGLISAEKVLKCGGILVVVSFHSLEDRLVKKFFVSRLCRVKALRHMIPPDAPSAIFQPAFKKVMIPTRDDIALNRRARSAKLRAGVRTSEKPLEDALSFANLARLPTLSQFGMRRAQNN